MIEQSANGCHYLLFEGMSRYPGLAHAVFTRRGGVSTAPFTGLNLAISTGDDPARVQQNGAIARAVLGLPFVSARPVHGNTVTFLTADDVAAAHRAEREGAGSWTDTLRARARSTEADAMVTDVPGFALFWAYGDCTPILLYDAAHAAIALVHAGWRGTARTVAPKTLAAMAHRFGTSAAEVYAAIGPAIGGCCYEVRGDLRDAFAADPLASATAAFAERPVTGRDGTRLTLDVAASNAAQLQAVGVSPDHIEYSGYCTGCSNDLFYSHRLEGEPSGRFGVAIGLRGAA